MRFVFAFMPLPIALLFSLSGLGGLDILVIIPVFIFGLLVGTFTHTYWLEVLLHEQEFYKRYYDENAYKPHKLDSEINLRHTKNLVPFYVFGILIFPLVLFIFGLFGVGLEYLISFTLGAFDGIPLSYMLFEKNIL